MLDLSFASEQWQRIVRVKDHPDQVNRRHFEACVFTYLAEEPRTGDIAVKGSQAYANWAGQLLSWEECEPLLDEFCSEVGLPDSARAFTEGLRTMLSNRAAEVDAGYPTNADLVIDPVTGEPAVKRRKAKQRSDSSVLLEEALKERMPERSLLDIVGRTAYWLEWWRRFGPASGSDPKLANPLLRYVLTTFTYGCNLGPAQAARHIRGVSAHELGATANRHFTIEKLNQAITDVMNAYLELDLIKAWGDGTSVAADGTQIDTLVDNLLAESHIRYGGFGGIAYTTLPTTTSPCSVTSYRAESGRRFTFWRGCSRTCPRSSRRKSMPTPMGRASRSTPWRTCSASSCCPGSATGRT